MKMKTRYVVSGILVTTGCAIWYISSSYNVYGLMLIGASGILINPNAAVEIFKLRPTWNPRRFFSHATIWLCALLIGILLSQLPEAEMHRLFGTWYFTGVTWLIMLSMLMTRFLEDKQKSLQADEPQSPEGVFSD